jgi:hypothetical protein
VYEGGRPSWFGFCICCKWSEGSEVWDEFGGEEVLLMEGGLEVFGEEEELPDLRLEELKKLKLLKCDDMSRRPEQRERGEGEREGECGERARVGVGVGGEEWEDCGQQRQQSRRGLGMGSEGGGLCDYTPL